MTAAAATLPAADQRALLASSPLAAAGGVAVVDLLDGAGLDQLAQEAIACRPAAREWRVERPALDGEARGQPERWLATAVGGPALRAFFGAPAVLALLRELTAVPWRPLGDQGTFSYYDRDGHFLGVHRDAVNCDLAVITCLHDDGGPGGQLVAYPGRAREPLASLRADPDRAGRPIALTPGRSAVVLGGLVPHRVTPVGSARSRIVAPLCYTLSPGPPFHRPA